jgi:hypothetical protein
MGVAGLNLPLNFLNKLVISSQSLEMF